MFTDPHAGFLRDAYTAAKFGLATRPEAIRLCDEWPDFQCRQDGRVFDYEVTEADEPDRRRSDEYKSGLHAGWRNDPVQDWVRRAERAPEAMRTAATRKAAKSYPKGTRLVIYLNIGEYGIRQTEIEAAMASATSSAREAFDEVWVLWKDTLYLVWHHGQPADTVLRMADELDTAW